MQEKFSGRIGRTREQSDAAWPGRPGAPAGAPNIVIVYVDDMGYSDPGCFGSEISTPHIDALAARGLRFNHYTTHPLCSPARAALLTGRNAHAVGSGWLPNGDSGFPGYRGEIPLDAPTLAETLRERGYATIMTGKWHNTREQDCVAAGSRHNWPAQRGFDTFYGVMQGEMSFFHPASLMLGNELLPMDGFPEDYYSTDDWTDQGIRFVKELRASAPAKPFFLYIAHNAVHSPLQARPRDIEKYKGRYDIGWTAIRAARLRRQVELGLVPPDTVLAPSDPRVPHWDDTDPADRALLARHMEVYAAMVDSVDQNMGKLLDFLESIGERDNTIIVFSSDNGGTDGGGPIGMVNCNRRFSGLGPLPAAYERARLGDLGSMRSMSLYPAGWGQVCNTPFPTFKTYTGGGGRRVSFVISAPGAIDAPGTIRQQFMHVTDVMPTLLDLAGVQPLDRIHGQPVQAMDGVSFAPVLADAAAASPRREQYYECWSNRAFYRNGWLARSLQKRGEPIDMENWSLHHLESDFSETTDLAAREPQRLRELVQSFDEAAWANQVYPLDNRGFPQKAALPHDPAADLPRKFLPGTQSVHRGDVLPLIEDRSFRLATAFRYADDDAGVLWAFGDQIAGMLLYVEHGQLHFVYNGYGEPAQLLPVPLAAGERTAVLEFEALGGRRGRARLLLDGQPRHDWADASPTMGAGMMEGLDIGLDRRAPVDADLYQRHGNFAFTGTIQHVLVEPGQSPSKHIHT